MSETSTHTQRQTRRVTNKKDRIPFGGQRQKLQLSPADQKRFEEEGYKVRWINDQHGRMDQALNAGYVFVKPEEAPSLGAGLSHEGNSDLNDKVSQVVSKGHPVIRAYFMKIKRAWWEEDQLEKEKINQRIDQSLLAVEKGGQSIEGGYTPK